MTVSGRERVRAALALDVADRPPVSAWGHTYEEEWGVESLATATVAIARKYEFDFVKLQIRATTFGEAFGGRWRLRIQRDHQGRPRVRLCVGGRRPFWPSRMTSEALEMNGRHERPPS